MKPSADYHAAILKWAQCKRAMDHHFETRRDSTKETLAEFRKLHDEMEAARRGLFEVLEGE